jgi:hypothetical protein
MDLLHLEKKRKGKVTEREINNGNVSYMRDIIEESENERIRINDMRDEMSPTVVLDTMHNRRNSNDNIVQCTMFLNGN